MRLMLPRLPHHKHKHKLLRATSPSTSLQISRGQPRPRRPPTSRNRRYEKRMLELPPNRRVQLRLPERSRPSPRHPAPKKKSHRPKTRRNKITSLFRDLPTHALANNLPKEKK